MTPMDQIEEYEALARMIGEHNISVPHDLVISLCEDARALHEIKAALPALPSAPAVPELEEHKP